MKNLKEKKDTVEVYKTKLQQEVSTKKALRVTQYELKKLLYQKDDSLKDMLRHFKKPKQTVVLKTRVKIDTIKMMYPEPVPVPFSKEVELNTSLYKIQLHSTEKGISLQNLEIPTTLRMVTGIKKRWNFTDISVDVSSSNPYIQIEDIQSQHVHLKKKRIGIGIFTGIDIRGQPTLGVGLNYTLIRL